MYTPKYKVKMLLAAQARKIDSRLCSSLAPAVAPDPRVGSGQEPSSVSFAALIVQLDIIMRGKLHFEMPIAFGNFRQLDPCRDLIQK